MKNDFSKHSDICLDYEKKIKEKEQAISELGSVVKKQQEQLKNKEESIQEKENQLVFDFYHCY